MISSTDGLLILKKWKRERTVVSFFALDFADFASRWEAKIRHADSSTLVVEMDGSPGDTRTFDLKGAIFDEAQDLSEVPEDLPFSDEQLKGLSFFLFIRLAEGLPIFFAVPARLN